MNTEKQKYPARRILTSTEKENFEEMVQAEKEVKTETDQFYPGPQMESGDSEQIQRVKRTMKAGEVDSQNRWERQEKEKRANKLKELLQRRMVPKSHIGLRASNNGVQSYEFRKAANSMAGEEMSAAFQRDAIEYKNLMRELGREEEANLESIRPESR